MIPDVLDLFSDEAFERLLSGSGHAGLGGGRPRKDGGGGGRKASIGGESDEDNKEDEDVGTELLRLSAAESEFREELELA